MLPRASAICRAGTGTDRRVIDRVVLDADERHRRRVVLTGERGTRSCSICRTRPRCTTAMASCSRTAPSCASPASREPLVEIAAADAARAARLAWHIGNRHTDVQIVGDRLRIRRDHVLEEMLRGLGAQLTPIEAPFDPEPGAYGHDHASTATSSSDTE